MSLAYIEKVAAGLNADLSAALGRFANNADLYARFLKKFPQDPTADSLAMAVEAEDFPQVERDAHTIKGVAANLGLEKLREKSDCLVKAVREGRKEDVPFLYEKFKEEYRKTTAIIKED